MKFLCLFLCLLTLRSACGQTDTVSPKQWILPVSLIAVGAAGAAIDGMSDFRLLTRRSSVKQIRADDYAAWAIFGWVFVCDLAGKEKHHWKDQLLLVGLTEALNGGIVMGMKYTLNVERPNDASHSFPSGHTANAFAGAHIAYKELKDSSPALACSGYLIAAMVGASRIYNNRHWVSDVLAGAGVGILSAELSYLIYFPLRDALVKRSNNTVASRLILAPVLNPQSKGVYLSYFF
ncbi:PAP2 (acid phosphatase) superfamily protein [Bacteroidales bacterium Barb4]|nr:PAP2 (acid phosphatase) superfamily protein [Bacteroidales bacterium Barb4]